MLQLLVERDLEKRPQKEFQLLSLVVKEKMTVAGVYDENRPCNYSVRKSQKAFFSICFLCFFFFLNKRIRKGCGIDSFQKSNVVFQLTVPINTCILVISHVLGFTWKRESKCRSPKARGYQVSSYFLLVRQESSHRDKVALLPSSGVVVITVTCSNTLFLVFVLLHFLV